MANTVEGTGGDDNIGGTGGSDVINGQGGNDVIRGNHGSDKIQGSTGNDDISGGQGKDKVKGGQGNDYLQGNGSDDTVYGGQGSDFIVGGDGNDFLSGTARSNTDGDVDYFAFDMDDGNDVIVNFEAGIDKLYLQDGGSVDSIVQDGNNVVITYGATQVTIRGALVADIQFASDAEVDAYFLANYGDADYGG